MHLISTSFVEFAFLFMCVYFFLGKLGQKLLIIAASYYFVIYASAWMALLLFVSSNINYLISRLVIETERFRKSFVIVGVALNVAMLGVFKYFNFFSQSLTDVADWAGVHHAPMLIPVVAPLGLSFYTFQAISYIVDVGRKRVAPPPWLDFILFLAFWPKFIAGPIIRATWFLPQLRHEKRFRWPNLYLGVEMIIYGLFLKVALSDNLIPQIDKVFSSPAGSDGANALVSAIFFSFQIYGDFAGYSLIVIGISRILGFSIRRNFNRPNMARSFSDFWSRWHISLSSWLEDYVFRSLIPRRSASSQSAWTSVSAMFADLLGMPTVDAAESFQSLSGDSMSYVQVALALEGMIGRLPSQWERLTLGELEGLYREGAVAAA